MICVIDRMTWYMLLLAEVTECKIQKGASMNGWQDIETHKLAVNDLVLGFHGAIAFSRFVLQCQIGVMSVK